MEGAHTGRNPALLTQSIDTLRTTVNVLLVQVAGFKGSRAAVESPLAHVRKGITGVDLPLQDVRVMFLPRMGEDWGCESSEKKL